MFAGKKQLKGKETRHFKKALKLFGVGSWKLIFSHLALHGVLSAQDHGPGLLVEAYRKWAERERAVGCSHRSEARAERMICFEAQDFAAPHNEQILEPLLGAA